MGASFLPWVYLKVDLLREKFKNMSGEATEKELIDINNDYNSFDEYFNKMLSKNEELYRKTSISILRKLRRMKEVNMKHQITLMQDFFQYCDAKFYHTFGDCNELSEQLLTDNLSEIILAILNLKWDALNDTSCKCK